MKKLYGWKPKVPNLSPTKSHINKDIIKVLIGQRRVGKSYMLFQIMDEILKKDKEANIIYISKELDDFEHIDYIVQNYGTIKDLEDMAKQLAKELEKDGRKTKTV